VKPPPRRELQEFVRDDIAGVFKVDHCRQDLLAPRAFVLVIERLLIADIGEVAANRGAESIHDALGARDVSGPMAIARSKDFDRPAQHAFEHVGHAQGLARRVCQRDARGVERPRLEMDGLARVGRFGRVGNKADQKRRETIGERQKQHRKRQVEGGVKIDDEACRGGFKMR